MEVGTLQVTLEDKQPGSDPAAKQDGAAPNPPRDPNPGLGDATRAKDGKPAPQP